VKLLCEISWLPLARTFKFRTLNPLVTPSVPLNWKVNVFFPDVIDPAGKFMVRVRVENPPPMPP